jgi:uncharacterized protein (TIGR02588 family)
MPDKKKQTSDTDTPKPERTKQPNQESVWEWIVAGIGAMLVLLTLGVLLYDALQPKSPPTISVQMQSIQSLESGYLVEFQATNRGGHGAAGVTIQGELLNQDQAVETSDTTLSYIAAGSHRSGGLYFKQDPRRFQLELRALGFEAP